MFLDNEANVTNRFLMIALGIMALGIVGLAISLDQKPVASQNRSAHMASTLTQNQSEMTNTEYFDINDLQLVELSSAGLVIIGFGIAVINGIGISPHANGHKDNS